MGGVVPGRGGQTFEDTGLPIFNTVEEAVAQTGANASMVFVPPPFAADSILEAIDAGIDLIVGITEGIPVRDMLDVDLKLKQSGSRLIGPNCPGVITPGQCKMGIMPGHIHTPGRVGVLSRSGTLTYEAVGQLSEVGLGQSTCVGIGGDPIIGTKFIDVLELFNADPGTESVIMIGEIGGSAEEEAAEWIRANMTSLWSRSSLERPLLQDAEWGMREPFRGQGTAESKFEALEAAGVHIVRSPAAMGKKMRDVLKGS